MAYPSFLSSCTFCRHHRRSVASFYPSSSCATTILLPNPCPLFLLRMHVTLGEVMTSVECRRAIGWKLADVTGVSLYMRLDAIPPWTPVISIARIPLPRYRLAPHTWRGGAIGIEKWCTPVQSHSFPRLSDPRGRRAPLSSSSRRSPILFQGCLSRLFPPFLLTTIKTIHRTFFSLAYMYCPSIPFISSCFVEF